MTQHHQLHQSFTQFYQLSSGAYQWNTIPKQCTVHHLSAKSCISSVWHSEVGLLYWRMGWGPRATLLLRVNPYQVYYHAFEQNRSYNEPSNSTVVLTNNNTTIIYMYLRQQTRSEFCNSACIVSIYCNPFWFKNPLYIGSSVFPGMTHHNKRSPEIQLDHAVIVLSTHLLLPSPLNVWLVALTAPCIARNQNNRTKLTLYR